MLAVNWGLKDFRGAGMTFVYANDSATAIASPFDRKARRWKQVTGLWTGTARSGTIKLKAAEAQDKSTSIVQSGARHPHPASNRDLLTAYLGGNRDAGNKLRRISKDAQPDVARIWKKLSEADRWKLMALPGCVPRKPALSQAVRSIDADSVNVRRQAVRWLARWLRRNKAPEAKPRLLKKLHTEKSSVRYEIVGALAEIGGKDVVDAMIELLAPDSWAAKGHYLQPYPGFPPYYWGDGRRTIVYALARLKAKRSAPALLKVLQEKGKGKGYLGEFIIPVLGDFGYGKAIPEFKTILATGEIAGVNLHRAYSPKRIAAERRRVKAKVNRLAARALLQLGDRSGCALLTKELANKDRDVRRFAAETFARFGDGADIPALERCRTDKDQGVREAAIEALKRIRAGKPKAIPFQPIPAKSIAYVDASWVTIYLVADEAVLRLMIPLGKTRIKGNSVVSVALNKGEASLFRGKDAWRYVLPRGAAPPLAPSIKRESAVSGQFTCIDIPAQKTWPYHGKTKITVKDIQLALSSGRVAADGPLTFVLRPFPPGAAVPANGAAGVGATKAAERAKPLDLDKTAKMLTKAAGGKWRTLTTNDVGVTLHGTMPWGGRFHTLCVVFPFRYDETGKAIVLSYAEGCTRPFRLLGSTEQCTVLADLHLPDPPAKAAAFAAAVSKALKLRPAKVTLEALRRSRQLRKKANINSFALQVWYHGPKPKPYYRLLLTAVPIERKERPFEMIRFLNARQAEKIIDHLAVEGFLTHAVKMDKKTTKVYKGPAYFMTIPMGISRLDGTLGWGPGLLKRLDALRKVLDGDAAKAMDKLLAQLERQHKEWRQANKEPNRAAVKLAPIHVWCQGALVLHAYDRRHGIIAGVPVPRKLHKALEIPVSGKLKQGKANVSYYRGKRIDNLLAPRGSATPPSGVGGTEYEKQEALSGSVTVTPLPGDADRRKVEVTFKDLVFKGFHIKKIGPLKVRIGLTPPP